MKNDLEIKKLKYLKVTIVVLAVILGIVGMLIIKREVLRSNALKNFRKNTVEMPVDKYHSTSANQTPAKQESTALPKHESTQSLRQETAIPSEPTGVFTVVYADSDDGFVNVRSKPSASGEILAQLYGSFHGLGDGVLVEKGESWSKVSVGGVTGWCNNRYLGYITWYEGNGGKILVSNKNNTPIYGDDLSGEERYPIFAYIPIDVIIADKYIRDGNYYVLVTAGDALRVSISDVYVR